MRRYGVVIKLLAAAAVATASAPAAELPLALCEDVEQIDTKLLTKPPKRGLLRARQPRQGCRLLGEKRRECGGHRHGVRGLRGAPLRPIRKTVRVRARRAV